MNEKSVKVKNRIGRNVWITILTVVTLLSIAFVFHQTFKSDAPVAPPIGADEAIEWHAFLVATNHYDVNIRNIMYAEADVDDLRRSLMALGVKNENISVLKSSNTEFSLGTSKEAIEDSYKEFLSRLTERSAAFVYLAGHGFCQSDWLGRRRSYYAPSDFQFEKTSAKRVSIDKMLKQLAKSKARFKWMCVDACRDPLDRGINSGSLSIASVPPGIVLTQSCELGQQSFEAGRREGAPFENGLFTRAFIDAINGLAPEVDVDQNGVLTLGELRDYVVARVSDDAQYYLNTEQNPVFTTINKESLDEFANYPLFFDLPIMGHSREEWQRGQKLREEAESFIKQGDYVGALEKINQACQILYDVEGILLLKEKIDKSFGENEAQRSLLKAEEELQARHFSEATDYLRRALEFDPDNQSYGLFRERLESEKNSYVLGLSILDSLDYPQLDAGELLIVKIAGIDVRFRWCPPGEFMMGCRSSEDDNYDGEILHKVELTRGFWIAETETTQALWKATMGENSNPSDNQGNELPVELVSWEDCQNFIDRIQVHAPSGLKFQLPTEAQWEYACRAGTNTRYSFGDEWDSNKANNGEHTAPSGSVDYVNPWGIKEMHGNVGEWVEDWIYSYSGEEAKDPKGPEKGLKRVFRGGSAGSEPFKCFSGIRFSLPPNTKAWNLGFRLALDRKTFESPYPPGELRIVPIAGIDVRFRWCPPGVFMMGSPTSEEGRLLNETQHLVMITQGYWLAETETSQKLWKAVMGSNPSDSKGDNLPVERVSWDDCQDFITMIRKYAPSGSNFQLPSEAHWEYACRAGTTTRYSWGNDWDSSKANNGMFTTKPVGSYDYVNAWNLKDMHGNVGEWCQDWYGPYPNGMATDPTGPLNGWSPVFRGGGGGGPMDCRSASRGTLRSMGGRGLMEEVWIGSLGFRLELTDVAK